MAMQRVPLRPARGVGEPRCAADGTSSRARLRRSPWSCSGGEYTCMLVATCGVGFTTQCTWPGPKRGRCRPTSRRLLEEPALDIDADPTVSSSSPSTTTNAPADPPWSCRSTPWWACQPMSHTSNRALVLRLEEPAFVGIVVGERAPRGGVTRQAADDGEQAIGTEVGRRRGTARLDGCGHGTTSWERSRTATGRRGRDVREYGGQAARHIRQRSSYDRRVASPQGSLVVSATTRRIRKASGIMLICYFVVASSTKP